MTRLLATGFAFVAGMAGCTLDGPSQDKDLPGVVQRTKTGTPGTIAKFVSDVDLGDSSLREEIDTNGTTVLTVGPAQAPNLTHTLSVTSSGAPNAFRANSPSGIAGEFDSLNGTAIKALSINGKGIYGGGQQNGGTFEAPLYPGSVALKAIGRTALNGDTVIQGSLAVNASFVKLPRVVDATSVCDLTDDSVGRLFVLVHHLGPGYGSIVCTCTMFAATKLDGTICTLPI